MTIKIKLAFTIDRAFTFDKLWRMSLGYNPIGPLCQARAHWTFCLSER